MIFAVSSLFVIPLVSFTHNYTLPCTIRYKYPVHFTCFSFRFQFYVFAGPYLFVLRHINRAVYHGFPALPFQCHVHSSLCECDTKRPQRISFIISCVSPYSFLVIPVHPAICTYFSLCIVQGFPPRGCCHFSCLGNVSFIF